MSNPQGAYLALMLFGAASAVATMPPSQRPDLIGACKRTAEQVGGFLLDGLFSMACMNADGYSCGVVFSPGNMIKVPKSLAGQTFGFGVPPTNSARTVALGLGEDLLEFAMFSGVPWQKWTGHLTRRSTTGKAFGRALTDTLRNSDRIIFNLTGMGDLQKAYIKGRGGFRYVLRQGRIIPANATNTELATIIQNKDFLHKTTFFRDGGRLSTNEVLEEIFNRTFP